MRNKNLRGTISVIEYSLFVAVLIAAIMGIQIYLKRALSARWRQSVDVFGHGRVYSSSPNIVWE